MPTIDLLTLEGQSSEAHAELLLFKPHRDHGEGKSPISMDARLRFQLNAGDVPVLEPLFPGVRALFSPECSWSGTMSTSPTRTFSLMVVDSQGHEVVGGDASLRGLRLVCGGVDRHLEVTCRTPVPEEGWEAHVSALRKVVTVRVTGQHQDEGKAPDEQLSLFGKKVRELPQKERAAFVTCLPDQVVEIRTGTRETGWAQVIEVLDYGAESVVVLRDLADGRAKNELPLGYVVRAVSVTALEGQKLQGLLNRHRSAVKKAGHGRLASWTWVMRSWEASGQLDSKKARVIDQDVLDRAAELVKAEAVSVEQRLATQGLDLPPSADMVAVGMEPAEA